MLRAAWGALGLLCSGCFLAGDYRVESTEDPSKPEPTESMPVVNATAPDPTATLPSASEATADSGMADATVSAITSAEPSTAPPTTQAPSATASSEATASALPAPSLTASSSVSASAEASVTAPIPSEIPDAGMSPDADAQQAHIPTCDTGWTYNEADDTCLSDCAVDESRGPSGRCYFFSTNAAGKAFQAARTECQQRGAGWDVLSAKTQVDDDYIGSQLQADTWLGASDLATPNTWLWLEDDTAFWVGDEFGAAVDDAHHNWGSNEPSAANDETCARYHSYSSVWRWSDVDCDNVYRVGCQGLAPVTPTYVTPLR